MVRGDLVLTIPNPPGRHRRRTPETDSQAGFDRSEGVAGGGMNLPLLLRRDDE